MSYANNKGADQSDQRLCFRCLDSVMSLVPVTKISSLMLVSVAEQASLNLTWSETPENTFSYDEAQLWMQVPSSMVICIHHVGFSNRQFD